jgi:hypothetical protein
MVRADLRDHAAFLHSIRSLGGYCRRIFMSAEIIQFVPRPNRRRVCSDDFPAATRSAFRPDDLTMVHADTAPCEYALCEGAPGEGDERK